MTMRNVSGFALPVLAIVVAAGCTLETEPPNPPKLSPANHVVINEVFTLPPTNQNFHSWIEIFNPTMDTVDLTDWSLNYTTSRLLTTAFVYKDTLRDTITTQLNLIPIDTVFLPTRVDSLRRYDVHFARGNQYILGPNEFLTLVNDMTKLEVYTQLGPGPGYAPAAHSLHYFFEELEIVHIPLDSTYITLARPDTGRYSLYVFAFVETDQIILKNASGQAVDVLRYGNYIYPGPGADPYPNNKSLGMMPELESFARYLGAYDTGNSANDFFVPRDYGVRPIPHYYSQISKP